MALYEFWDGLREALELAEKHPDYSAELIHELLVGVDFHRPYQDFEWILRQAKDNQGKLSLLDAALSSRVKTVQRGLERLEESFKQNKRRLEDELKALGEMQAQIPEQNKGSTMDRIAAVMGMSTDDLARNGLDLDVFHNARWLIDNGIDLTDRTAVEKILSADSPGFIDAVLIAANEGEFTE